MINLPSDYSTAKAYDGTSVLKLTPGGHICRTRTVMLTKSKSGNDMLVADFDIVEEGEFRDYYRRQYEYRSRYYQNASWPGRYYMPIANSDGTTNTRFKGFIAAIEESNSGYRFNGDELGLQNKLVGFNFGEEEYCVEATGEIKTTVKPAYAVSVAKVREGVIPPAKKPCTPPGASGYSGGQSTRSATVPGIMQPPRNEQLRMDMYGQGTPVDDDDELPF